MVILIVQDEPKLGSADANLLFLTMFFRKGGFKNLETHNINE